jgi:hypothetical protein
MNLQVPKQAGNFFIVWLTKIFEKDPAVWSKGKGKVIPVLFN